MFNSFMFPTSGGYKKIAHFSVIFSRTIAHNHKRMKV